jgi:hypothetical protein
LAATAVAALTGFAVKTAKSTKQPEAFSGANKGSATAAIAICCMVAPGNRVATVFGTIVTVVAADVAVPAAAVVVAKVVCAFVLVVAVLVPLTLISAPH